MGVGSNKEGRFRRLVGAKSAGAAQRPAAARHSRRAVRALTLPVAGAGGDLWGFMGVGRGACVSGRGMRSVRGCIMYEQNGCKWQLYNKNKNESSESSIAPPDVREFSSSPPPSSKRKHSKQ